jgi:hypothetical protein
MGGFNGTDSSSTLEQFQQMVASGEIHYCIAGGGIGVPNGGSRVSTESANWVASTFQATQLEPATVSNSSTVSQHPGPRPRRGSADVATRQGGLGQDVTVEGV